MGQTFQQRNRRNIQRVAGHGFKGADAAFAQNHLFVAARHDVFGAHQQLFDGTGQTAFQQNRLVDFAQLFQQLKVLHIARAHLNDIHILEQLQMRSGHDLGHDRQTGFGAGFAQQFQPFGAQALERIGRGAGLERAATQKRRAGRFDILGDLHDLLLAFHRAGTRDHAQATAADHRAAAQIDHRILGMEFAVGFFIRLLHPLDAFHLVLRRQRLNIHRGGISQQTQHGRMGAVPGVDRHIVTLRQFAGEIFRLCSGRSGF